MENKTKDIPANKPQKDTFETIWKTINIIILFIQLYCIPGFLSFREIAAQQKIHFVRSEAWYWAAGSCVIYGVRIIKYVFFAVSKSTAYAIVHPKYHANDGERLYRAQAILKLTFDLIFYSCTTFAAFFLFKDKYWFPKQLGGAGSADEIFREYPDYPSDSDPFILETYYMVQLGVYAFKIIESFAIRRKTYRKVYEFLLHHFIAQTLIVFSVMSNLLPVGIVILFLHDCCDMTADMVRIYVETKFRKTSISVLLFILGAGNWFYMRLVVFPLYPLKALYDNIPGPQNICYRIWFQHTFLVILSCILIVMHVYWWIYIMKGGLSMIFGKGITNPHDKGTSKVKET